LGVRNGEYLEAALALAKARGWSGRELCRRAELSHQTFMRIRRFPDGKVLRTTDDRIREVLGDELPVPEFDNDRRRQAALENLTKYGHLSRTPTARRAAAEKMRNWSPAEEHRAAISGAAVQRHHERPELGRSLGDFQQSAKGKAKTSLLLRLAWHASPDWQPGDGRPVPTSPPEGIDSKLLGIWAKDYADSAGLTKGQVLEMWKPYRKTRHLPAEVGRPPDEIVCAEIERLELEDEAEGNGRWGRNDRVAAHLNTMSGSGYSFPANGVAQFKWRHGPVCRRKLST
jgi:hypothetical protein